MAVLQVVDMEEKNGDSFLSQISLPVVCGISNGFPFSYCFFTLPPPLFLIHERVSFWLRINFFFLFSFIQK